MAYLKELNTEGSIGFNQLWLGQKMTKKLDLYEWPVKLLVQNPLSFNFRQLMLDLRKMLH